MKGRLASCQPALFLCEATVKCARLAVSQTAGVMHRLLTFGPRVGFVLLLGVLVGFELLFVSEGATGRAALAAQRNLAEARAEQTLDDALLGALDVAEARL